MLLLGIGTVIAVVYMLPFYVAIVNSFKTDQDASLHPLALPATWTTAAFSTLFRPPTWHMGVKLRHRCDLRHPRSDFLRLSRGYALARLRFPGQKAVFAGLIAVMAVPGVVLLIPKFLVINSSGSTTHTPA